MLISEGGEDPPGENVLHSPGRMRRDNREGTSPVRGSRACREGLASSCRCNAEITRRPSFRPRSDGFGLRRSSDARRSN